MDYTKQEQFKAWHSEEDKKYFAVAEIFYYRTTKPYLKANEVGTKTKQKKIS